MRKRRRAGDAFNGGFAAVLAERCDPVEAARFGCAGGRAFRGARPRPGASMPGRAEIDALLDRS
ncbi:hypothetical protein [uncultured Jannaschia sp.]|uniref:hypothetical protein n=1 Tax=uncultured Jannaschia sp. TaxID=293347 RepID=UPI002632C010|nr:hypothetical protein [uncultured Jannaschia sp.]